MVGLLGKKLGMTRIFDEGGFQRPVTLLEVGPCFVTDLKKKKEHGYSAVQLAYDTAKEKRLNRPHLGHLKRAKVPALKILREVRTEDTEGLEIGRKVTIDNFEVGDFVDVRGVSIGKGYQGVVKRHHFKGGEKAHGCKMGRESGSIGQGHSDPKRVPKGRRMAGHMGHENVTIQNLKVLKVDKENGFLAVQGAVPGVEGGYLMVKTALKRGKLRRWKVQSGQEDAVAKATSLATAQMAESGEGHSKVASENASSREAPAKDTKSEGQGQKS